MTHLHTIICDIYHHPPEIMRHDIPNTASIDQVEVDLKLVVDEVDDNSPMLNPSGISSSIKTLRERSP